MAPSMRCTTEGGWGGGGGTGGALRPPCAGGRKLLVQRAVLEPALFISAAGKAAGPIHERQPHRQHICRL
eukprot:8343524-Prorocentrum_lima.AAC.1